MSTLYRRDDLYIRGRFNGLICLSSNSQHISFLEVLRDFFLCQHPNGDQPVPILDNDDIAELWHNVDVEGLNLLLGHESQDIISNSQDMIFEDHVTLGVKGLQAEANAILNPEWTLNFEDLAVAQSTGPSVRTDHFLAGVLDPML